MSRKAVPIVDRKLILADGGIIQIRVWRLPGVSQERPHGLKYSLFYGRHGDRIVGYDNEAGEGDHRHYRGREEPYTFHSLSRLTADFERDVRKERGDE